MLEAFQPVTDPASLLKRDGYLVLENHLDAARLRTVCDELAPHFEAVPFGTGAFYGGETKRFGRALSRSRSAASLVLDPAITTIVQAVLLPHCERLQLN